MAAEQGQRIEPHGKIMEILALAVRLFADADAAQPAEHAIDLIGLGMTLWLTHFFPR